jgi:predicted transcriptional regulator
MINRQVLRAVMGAQGYGDRGVSELARAANIPTQTLHKILTGERFTASENATHALATTLGLDVDILAVRVTMDGSNT